MTIVSKGRAFPCCVETQPSFVEKARYAIRMLLLPLGLEPEWRNPGEFAEGLYYGTGTPPDGDRVTRLAASQEAAAFYEHLSPYDAHRVLWFEEEGKRLPALFHSETGEPDLIASTFLWLSGWQEAALPDRDEHGRFPYANSLSAMLDVARRAVVDEYRALIRKRLEARGVSITPRKWSGRSWAFCPTHDVDYVRKWRPGILYREFGQNLVLNRTDAPIASRINRAGTAVRQLVGPDPYRRALQTMPETVTQFGGTATYFVKGGGGDPHDVRYSVRSSFLRKWFKKLAERRFEVGLHPSYSAADDVQLLAEEKERVEAAIGSGLTSVRQHYLRYDPVRTPQDHAELGFLIDSTLGFAEREGFRRGTCLPFQLYDLEKDAPLDLWEMPLIVMESALFNRRQMDVEIAASVTQDLATVCRRHGGALVGLWHNTLGDEIECPGWEEHFRTALAHAQAEGAHISSLKGALEGWS